MEPTDSLHPQSGEAAVSLETGLVVLAIGAIIFAYLMWKLVGEYRERKAQRDRQEPAGEPTCDEPPGDES